MNYSDYYENMKDIPGASETVQDHRNLHAWSNATQDKLPINMRFNEGHQLSIIVYSILMVFSAIANTTVLVLIVKRRRKTPSRINTMLMHLAIADLLVSTKEILNSA
ncbi:hypothetical protein Zmor_003671 [Zophobas morio]|uniref:G-protein coupled receptors family 1 profile domain-containing protein n=1 Tax=Zophobas morio TaxID=2755281 RepID=A0AA38HN60_9CUCU|nr:hypothetical protein Zmor_003671 [Zophobas morio]